MNVSASVCALGEGGDRASFSTTEFHEPGDGSASLNGGSPVDGDEARCKAKAQGNLQIESETYACENESRPEVGLGGPDQPTPANDAANEPSDKPSDSAVDSAISEDDPLEGIRAAYAFKVVPSQIKELLDKNTHAFRVTPENGMESTSVASSHMWCCRCLCNVELDMMIFDTLLQCKSSSKSGRFAR